MNIFPIWIVAILVFKSFVHVSSIKVNSKFQYCNVGSIMHHLNLDDACLFQEQMATDRTTGDRLKNVSEIFVFSKHSYVVDGAGFECSMRKTEYAFEKSIFLSEFPSNDDGKYVKLSSYDCLNMVKSINC